MLVLTRKLGEGLVLGPDINLKILEIHKNQIKLGIEAPSDIKIYRNEVYEQIKEENLQASKTKLDVLQSVIGIKEKSVKKSLPKEFEKA